MSQKIKKQTSQIIGVDVGGTKMLLQAFDQQMRLTHEEKIFTETKKNQKGWVDQLFDLIQKHFHAGIRSIGVAVPGIVNQKKGLLIKAPHLPVKNLALRQILENRFKRPIALDNDGNAFLYAQSKRALLQKYKNLIAVMPGTGLGGAMMIEGKLVYGKHGYAGELAHMILRSDSTLDTFEKNTTGSYVPKIAKELGISKKFNSYNLSENSPEAKKVKKHLIRHLGLGLASLNLIFNPEAFVLGGSIYNYFLKDAKKELQKIIAAHALDATSPPIFDTATDTPARGIALMSAGL